MDVWFNSETKTKRKGRQYPLPFLLRSTVHLICGLVKKNAYRCYSDMDWYRAEIVWMEGESARVIFIDYGNEETVPVTKVFDVLCEDLKKHPRLVVACKLAAVEPGTDDGWSDASKQYFRSLLTADEYRFTVTFLSQEQDVYTVALKSTNGSSLAQKFVALEAGEVQIVTNVLHELVLNDMK